VSRIGQKLKRSHHGRRPFKFELVRQHLLCKSMLMIIVKALESLLKNEHVAAVLQATQA
jgi:hypothetical protein